MSGHHLRSNPITIHISAGAGEGPTELAAFDAALMNAGVANYNLLCLSSVIPPGATLVRRGHTMGADDYGRRLYVVMSQMRQSETGADAHAGIGWIQEQATGRGLFVELHDSNRCALEHDLRSTLEAMRRAREIEYDAVNTVIESRRCTNQPVCALVVAVFRCEPW